jgi:hypothetical protein
MLELSNRTNEIQEDRSYHTFPTFGMPTIAVCKPIESVVCVYLLVDRANPGRVKLDACEKPADTCSRAAAKIYSMIRSLFIFRTRLDVMWTVMSTITIYRCRVSGTDWHQTKQHARVQDFRQAASRPSKHVTIQIQKMASNRHSTYTL